MSQGRKRQKEVVKHECNNSVHIRCSMSFAIAHTCILQLINTFKPLSFQGVQRSQLTLLACMWKKIPVDKVIHFYTLDVSWSKDIGSPVFFITTCRTYAFTYARYMQGYYTHGCTDKQTWSLRHSISEQDWQMSTLYLPHGVKKQVHVHMYMHTVYSL